MHAGQEADTGGVLHCQLAVNLINWRQSYLLVHILVFIILENDLQVAQAVASGKDLPDANERLKVIFTLPLKIQCHLCTH